MIYPQYATYPTDNNLITQSNIDQLNQAAMQVIQRGYNNGIAQLNNYGTMRPVDPDYNVFQNIQSGGLNFAPGDPRIEEAGNQFPSGFSKLAESPFARQLGTSMLGRGLKSIGLGFALPVTLAYKGLKQLSGINSNFQNSLFGRSRTISDYLAAKRQQKLYEEIAARGQQKEINRNIAQGTSGDVGGGWSQTDTGNGTVSFSGPGGESISGYSNTPEGIAAATAEWGAF